MQIEELKDSACYEPKDMPLLKTLLDDWISTGMTCRIHIRSGTPRCWFGRQYIKHVHANLTLKRGIETSRSKNLTGEVLAMPVARWELDRLHRTARILIFARYGKKKHRERKNQDDAAPRTMNTTTGTTIIIPDDIDDDLPFN